MSEVKLFECNFSDSFHRQKLVELINQYIADEMGAGEPITGKKADDLLDGLDLHPSKFIIFAAINNEIVGLTNCFINFGTFAAKPFLNIHDIIVSKNFRGKGVGKKLMEGIIKKAEELGCAKITLEVREDNHKAQQLYKSLGFFDCEPKMYFWEKKMVG